MPDTIQSCITMIPGQVFDLLGYRMYQGTQCLRHRFVPTEPASRG
jgi:hypothetical protein